MKEEKTDKLFYEREMLRLGAQYIAGVDEVGRGPFAGPVVAAAVILPLDDKSLIEGIDDSKELKEKERERLAALIKERAVAYQICEEDNRVIDRINILQATKLCMKRAVEQLCVQPDVVFVDGNFKIDISLPQQSIIKGDALSYSIGAASILAKVYRDALMERYAEEYPQYGFGKNKGYGTAEHIKAIGEYGLCPIHRRTFAEKFWDAKGRKSRKNT